MPASFDFRVFRSLLASIVILAAVSSCGGGGGGGGTGGGNPGTISGATLSVNWPKLTRSYDVSLTSARSAIIVLSGGKVGGGDVTFTIDRDPAKLDAFTQQYNFSADLNAAASAMAATFYSQAGGKGTAVGTAAASAGFVGSVLTFTPISLVGVIKSVAVMPSTVFVNGGGTSLSAGAYDASGTAIAVDLGSFQWNLVSGGSSMSLLPDGTATAITPGVATVTATIDGIVSPVGTITVGAARPPVAPDPTCGIALQKAPIEAHTLDFGPNTYIPDSSRPDRTRGPESVRTLSYISIIGGALNSQNPTGYAPADIRGLYGGTQPGSGAIAIVLWNDYPTALNDFNFFSSYFNLPTESSTNELAASNTVFQKIYATGIAPPASADTSLEAALDIEWAHAMAPSAKIYLVEAASGSLSDTMAAVNIAKALPGVKQVSMSWITDEAACSFVKYDGSFIQPGVTFFAGSGDIGGQRGYPSLSKNVVSVGGTDVEGAPQSGLSESVWISAGGGPSQFEPRPVIQDPFYTLVGLYRSGPDISAVAFSTGYGGVSVYDSTPQPGQSSAGWTRVFGTSAATPIVAGLQNASGANANSSVEALRNIYSNLGTTALYDVTAGYISTPSNLQYYAGAGFDIPSGVGTPRSPLAFYWNVNGGGTVNVQRKGARK